MHNRLNQPKIATQRRPDGKLAVQPLPTQKRLDVRANTT